jgi:hypothetical protein
LAASLVMALMCQSCYVSRCSNPRMTGYVRDAQTGQPLANCTVRFKWSPDLNNGTVTNSDGYYELKEKRYRQWTFIAMEAPPMRFNLLYAMPGYEKQDVRHIYSYGGSAPKGEHMELEAVHMIPKR